MRWTLSTFCRFIFFFLMRLTDFTKPHHKPIVSFVLLKSAFVLEKYKPGIKYRNLCIYGNRMALCLWRIKLEKSHTNTHTCIKRIVREYCSCDMIEAHNAFTKQLSAADSFIDHIHTTTIICYRTNTRTRNVALLNAWYFFFIQWMLCIWNVCFVFIFFIVFSLTFGCLKFSSVNIRTAFTLTHFCLAWRHQSHTRELK